MVKANKYINISQDWELMMSASKSRYSLETNE